MVDSIETIEKGTVAIRFAGDSGDGMQLTGTQFTETTTVVGNDIATFPDFLLRFELPPERLPGCRAIS